MRRSNKESLQQDYNVDGSSKRKTPLQLEALENLYTEDKYPSHKTMEDIALSLKLSYKQVRGWFVERRRKEKRENGGKMVPTSSLKCNRLQRVPSKNHTRQHNVGSNNTKDVLVHTKNSTAQVKKRKLMQRGNPFKKSTLPLDFILKKVFRKDGPPLGVKFDPLPPGAFDLETSGSKYGATCARNKRMAKKRKVSNAPVPDIQVNTKKCVPRAKHGMGKGLMTMHGMGKGLMTVWRATNPGSTGYPTGIDFTGKGIADMHFNPKYSKLTKPVRRKMNIPHHKPPSRQGRLMEKKKRAARNAKVSSKKAENSKKPHQQECSLALEGLRSQEYPDAIAKLVDDEELELRELQAGSNPITCSAHLAFNGMHNCSLCKDLLARFPPHSVKMKPPLCVQPWNTSLEIVKKLFKVFRFLYSHSINFDICPFTLDEFAQAFHDKDSMLLVKIHVALLKVLFSDLEMELSGESIPQASKNYRYVGFLHWVRQQEYILKFWNRYLNPLTWAEILRQVLIAAGFNSKQSKFREEHLNKDDNHLAEYGLRPGTLKGEVFSILAEHGNNGLKVSELSKALRVVDLHLTKTNEELELLICSTLSSDITLFEKISPTAYRVRSNPLNSEGVDIYHSDSEDSGSDGVACGDITNSSDESELDAARACLNIVNHKQHFTKKSNMLVDYTEIDESDSGELWLLALTEGEYSELSLEEKLNTLVALVDLTSAGSSIRTEIPVSIIKENIATIPHHGGAKIKRSAAKQNNLTNIDFGKEIRAPSQFVPFEPLNPRMKCNGLTKKSDFWVLEGSKTSGAEAAEVELDGHPLQSIYLGSDRRFNSYWLFLGPCKAKDPGHRRIYFESSEDGHWEVIDTKEALSSLLSVLDGRGSREARLLATLMRLEAILSETMSTNMISDNDTGHSGQSDQSSIDIIGSDGSSPISEVDNNLNLTETVNERLPSSGAIVLEHRKVEGQKRKWDRLQAFDVWIWNSFYSNLNAVKHSKTPYLESLVRCSSCHDLYWRDEKHCKICHSTFELDFDLEERYAIHVATCREDHHSNVFPKHKVLSTHLQTLKAALHAIEGVMPKEALVNAWTMSDHKLWVARLRRTSSLSELIQVLTDFVGAINEDFLCQCNRRLDCDTYMIESFTTMPQTTSAVALWLVKLDMLIAPHLGTVESAQGLGRNTK